MKFYLSYNQSDFTAANYFVQKLRQHSIDIWIDLENLKAGELISSKIDNGLRICDGIIVVIGQNGLVEWQQLEVQVAKEIRERNNRFVVIPVYLPGGSGLNVPSFLAGFVPVDFKENLESQIAWESVLHALGGTVFPEKGLQQEQKHESQKDISPTRPQNRRAVSVAVLNKNSLLLVKRALTQKSGGGLWQLPGGKVDNGEEALEAAIRETSEEVGVLLDKRDLSFITDVVDSWLKIPGDTITMTIFCCSVTNKNVALAEEFSEYEWVDLTGLHLKADRLYFGSTERYLRFVRRYLLMHLPLSHLSRALESITGGDESRVPTKLEGLSPDSTMVLYSVLSLLGFLDDKKLYQASSLLSANIIKSLAAWSLTEGVIFEAEGDGSWFTQLQASGDHIVVEKFRQGLFERHRNILGMLSHRLPKALSTRNVSDVLILGQKGERKYLLIRWDFLAEKFQIPAKGLEDVGFDINSTEAAKYVVAERLSKEVATLLTFSLLGRLRTSHVGAGSLGDGPIMRNFVVSIYYATAEIDPVTALKLVTNVNMVTSAFLKNNANLEDSTKRSLNYYVWADVEMLLQRPKQLLGRKLQGLAEILDEIGAVSFRDVPCCFPIENITDVPIISSTEVQNEQYLDIIENNELI